MRRKKQPFHSAEWQLWARSNFWARWNFHNRFAFQNNRVSNCTLARQLCSVAVLYEFDHLDGCLDCVSDPHGRLEAQCLRDIDRPGPGNLVPMTAEISPAV